MKARILIILMLTILVGRAANTNWFFLPINQGGQIGPAGTNLFGTNLVAGTGITFVRGTNGEITINGGTVSTNFNGILITNAIFGSNYVYGLGTNFPTAILSWEMFTNLMVQFTNGLASQAYAQGLTNGFVGSASGLGTNNTFYSPTNQPQASNQVVATFNGLGGQTNDLLRVQSNGTTVVTIKPSGNVGIGTNAPAVSLDVIGAGHFSSGITNTAGVSFSSANFTLDSSGNMNANGSLVLSSGSSISWAGEAGFSSTASGDVGAFGSGFAALNTFYFGKRDSNTHAIVFASSPPKWFFRDGTKNSNCPVTVGTMSISNNYAPGTNADLFDIYMPMSSTLDIQVFPNGAMSILNGLTNKSTIYAPTNTAPIVTASNPTNSYTTGTVYFNLAQRSILVGSAVLNGGVSGSANITLNYTNEGTGYQLPMQTGAGLATTDIFPFCVPLSTNASFQFIATMGTGATGSLTNVVLWQH